MKYFFILIRHNTSIRKITNYFIWCVAIHKDDSRIFNQQSTIILT